MAIDIKRSVIGREMGNKVVEPNTTFQAGMIVQYESDGNIVVTDGTAPCGIAKWNKTSTLNGTAVAEAQTLTLLVANNLKHSNVTNVKVRSTATGGTLYSAATDYTIANTNGTIVRQSGSAIPSGGTVYVTYTYQLSTAEITKIGTNFSLNQDDTVGSGRITVIQGLSTVYTDQYDTSLDYAINDQLYPMNNGKFTNNAGYNKPFGRVISVPTASDPFLGVEGNFTNDR